MTRLTPPGAKARGHRTPPVELERLYTKAETAELLNISQRFVTRLVLERRIRFVKVGRLVRIPRSAIEELLVTGTVERIG